MDDKEEHLRGAANELLVHLPLDYRDALKILDYLRFLVEWRHHGTKNPAPARNGDGPSGEAGPPFARTQDPEADCGSNPKIRNIASVRPRVSPLRT